MWRGYGVVASQDCSDPLVAGQVIAKAKEREEALRK
jgi:hypothetical protein